MDKNWDFLAFKKCAEAGQAWILSVVWDKRLLPNWPHHCWYTLDNRDDEDDIGNCEVANGYNDYRKCRYIGIQSSVIAQSFDFGFAQPKVTCNRIGINIGVILHTFLRVHGQERQQLSKLCKGPKCKWTTQESVFMSICFLQTISNIPVSIKFKSLHKVRSFPINFYFQPISIGLSSWKKVGPPMLVAHLLPQALCMGGAMAWLWKEVSWIFVKLLFCSKGVPTSPNIATE